MKTSTLNKIIDTVNILTIPVASVIAIWADFDAGVYVAGTAALICSICEYLKLFCKK